MKYSTKTNFTGKGKSSSPADILAKRKLAAMRRRRANPAKNMSSIARLDREVRKLKVSEFGQKQIQRQFARTSAALPDSTIARLSASFPVGFCHQAISEQTQIYQFGPDPISGSLTALSIGTWTKQTYPPLLLDPTSLRFDTLKYLQRNSLDVQPGYYMHNSVYDCYFNAINWRGWVNIQVVEPRMSYTRQLTPNEDLFQMPEALGGFANSCPGTPVQYAINPLFYKVTTVKRFYLNTAGTGAVSEYLHTNPDVYAKIKVTNSKHKAHIRAQIPLPAIGNPIISYLDIPLKQQSWIVFTASNLTPPAADSYCSLNLTRCNVWRDSIGSS